MRNIISIICSAILMLAMSVQTSAQVTFTVQPAQNLVQDVLVGEGVQIFNVTNGGAAAQVGFFNGGNSVNLGIDSGVVMTTGNIPAMMDPLGFNFIGSPAMQNNISTGGFNNIANSNDPDLNAILNEFGVIDGFPGLTNNVSIIEFDFIPEGNFLKFNYVFGSEEYFDYVCTQYFDVFGFFLSGPGISGPYTDNAVNLAIVPGTNLPVGINTINDGISDASPVGQSYCPDNGLDNSEFYVDFSNSQNFAVYGATQVLSVESPVTCGETYHIKLVIANGTDQAFDSWVFFEAESFLSTPIDINIANLLPDSAIVEGCTEGELVFKRNNANDLLTVFIEYAGDASGGNDYTGMLDSLVFPIGVDSIAFTLTPVDDGIVEGVNGYETISLIFTVVNECNDTAIIERTLKIRDPYTLNIQPLSDTLACPQSNFTVGLNISGGYPPYVYQWADNGQITPTINVPITQSETFQVQITDALNCTFAQYTDSVVVTMNYDSLTSAPQDIIICSGDTINIDAFTENGLLPHNITWSNGLNTDTISVTATDSTIFTFTAIDACGISVVDTFFVNVPIFDSLYINTIDTIICNKGGQAILVSAPVGGAGDFVYTWTGPPTITLENDSSASVQPSTTTTYFISVTDKCGTTAIDSMVVEVITCDLKASNAFSPNGDGTNDFFTIANIEFYPGSIVYLYSRWGKKVFEQVDYQNNWSGDDSLISGTYFYVVEPNDGSAPLKGYVAVFKE